MPLRFAAAAIERLERSIQKKVIRYSVWKQQLTGDYQVLIIDNIGMLSSLYRYGQVAYIGGGFGKGIHNTLEAATFGMPIIFGPVHTKFQEAMDLIKMGGAFSISNFQELKIRLDELFNNPGSLQTAQKTSSGYVKNHIGATGKILSKIWE